MDSRKFGKSRLDLAEIDAVLQQSGFQFAFYARTSPVWRTYAGWARRTRGFPCFDRVMFFLCGEKHDEISVDVGVSLVPTSNTWLGLFESHTFDHELAREKLISIGNNRQRTEFIERVVPEIDQAYQGAPRDLAAELVERTQRARAAASYYSQAIPDSIPDLDVFLERQLGDATADERQLIKQAPYWCLISFKGSQAGEVARVFSCYKIAVATIVLAARNFDQHGFFRGTEDIDDCCDLPLCIQILASRIHSPALWT